MISFTSKNITYWISFPAYPISLFVDHFILMKGQTADIEERIFPNNKTEMFFNLSDSVVGRPGHGTSSYQLKESVISGTRSSFFIFKTASSFSMAGLRFTLFGFNHLFRMPAYHFTDHHFNTKDVWGYEMEWVREQLLESENRNERFKVLNDWITTKISSASLQDMVKWKQIENKICQFNLRITPLLTKVVGYSHKHCIHLLKEKAGLAPKSIQKICRFEWVLQMIAKQEVIHWQDIVYRAGYADQSHLIREFKYFTGFTPIEYMSARHKSLVFH
ncbi:helix-turn-helix domain-containing protein [Catalinimonas niigatensis]|uniref:helix-turn-helix domain-containing protein n=1 Tax=Catalinimonas niigatensis TaxID=1397264 RepID=UPI00266565E9|nr:AraC family transcriptional regulator [Catalinimonas niigatensis]WPP50154.1 AraC family transcriptional regulator [Catalinimonas niigatensis]